MIRRQPRAARSKSDLPMTRVGLQKYVTFHSFNFATPIFVPQDFNPNSAKRHMYQQQLVVFADQITAISNEMSV